MKKNRIVYFTILLLFSCISVYAQYDEEAINNYVRAYGQMSQRVIEIMHAVQPYREEQYQKFKEGKYFESIEPCIKAIDEYIYYEFDNKAISDMEELAGDAAMHIPNYEWAVYFYTKAKRTEMANVDYKLEQVFEKCMSEADRFYRSEDYSSMMKYVNLARKTGYENGYSYYLTGIYYESNNYVSEAKKMFKKSKKMGCSYAEGALQRMKYK